MEAAVLTMTESVLDHRLVTERYFFPRRAVMDNPFWVKTDGGKLGCYYHPQDPEEPTVIIFHGNGEVVEDYLDLYIPAFEHMDYNVLLAEYRGYGMSEGTPVLAGMLDDVEKIVKALKVPQEQMIFFGRSIGSLYALHGAAKFPKSKALIIESGIADILERVLLRVQPEEMETDQKALEKEVQKVFDHKKKLAKFKGSTLIMHARRDSLIPYTHAEQLFQWAPQPKHIRIFEQGDHNDILAKNAEEYFKELYTFLLAL